MNQPKDVALTPAGKAAIHEYLAENPEHGDTLVQRHLVTREMGRFRRKEVRDAIGNWKKDNAGR